MLQLLAFARSPLGRYALAALAIMVISMAIYAKGRHDGKAGEIHAEAQRLKAAQAKVAKRELTAAKITEGVGAKFQSERVVIRYRTRTIRQEIPANVTPADDAACRVPDGWMRLHDAAALGGTPAVPPGPR